MLSLCLGVDPPVHDGPGEPGDCHGFAPVGRRENTLPLLDPRRWPIIPKEWHPSLPQPELLSLQAGKLLRLTGYPAFVVEGEPLDALEY